MKKSFTLHDLPREERPRERLARLGPEALSTQELIALILGRGVPGEPVMVTSQNLLSYFGSIDSLLNSSLEDLQQVKGIGIAKASQITACLEIARRLKNVHTQSQPQLSSPDEAFQLLYKKIGHFKKEHFVLVSLDTRNRVISIDSISVGTLNASLVHPREMFEIAFRRHASTVIVAHNHPSGDPDPSDEDLRVTSKLMDAGKLLGIHVLDHIIVGKDSYYSFQRENNR